MLSYQPVLHPPVPTCSSMCSSVSMAETESLFLKWRYYTAFFTLTASNTHGIIFGILASSYMFCKHIKAPKCCREGWQNRWNYCRNLFSFHRKRQKNKFLTWEVVHESLKTKPNITKSCNSYSQHNLPYWNKVTKHIAFCLLNITDTLHSVLPKWNSSGNSAWGIVIIFSLWKQRALSSLL